MIFLFLLGILSGVIALFLITERTIPKMIMLMGFVGFIVSTFFLLVIGFHKLWHLWNE